MTAAVPLVAMGDPQAPFSRVTDVLRHHGLVVGSSNRSKLAPHARLLSIGDHFDWGGPSQPARDAAAADGERCLRWLTNHPAEQVVVLVGNHDLARVGELCNIDDDTFARMQSAADSHYYGGGDDNDEAAFFRQCPFLPSTEIVARDLSTYRATQQQLMVQLLRKRRLRLAHAEDGLLFTHAGVTRRALWRMGLAEGAAEADVAAALNGAFDDAIDRCVAPRRRTPLHIPGLHRPADGIGEGDGVLYHRPTHVDDDKWLEPRRFDPRRLPPGLWQVVGHVRDKRCVEALEPWSVPRHHQDGVIRHLIAIDGDVTYRHGPPPPRHTVSPEAAVMIFIDGAMNICPPDAYELLDSRQCRPHRA